MSDSPPAITGYASAGTILNLLCEQFPQTFFRYHRQPLAIGIREEILQALNGGVSEYELVEALSLYTSSAAYLRNCRAGAIRVDIDGQPAGIVSEGEAEFAQRKIVSRQAPATRGRSHENRQ